MQDAKNKIKYKGENISYKYKYTSWQKSNILKTSNIKNIKYIKYVIKHIKKIKRKMLQKTTHFIENECLSIFSFKTIQLYPYFILLFRYTWYLITTKNIFNVYKFMLRYLTHNLKIYIMQFIRKYILIQGI